VFRIVLRINSDYLCKQDEAVSHFKGDAMFSVETGTEF
jgi:hypothetical protein